VGREDDDSVNGFAFLLWPVLVLDFFDIVALTAGPYWIAVGLVVLYF
jgi:hypothetical protein